MPDNVNHPSHYGGKDDPYETIKVLRHKLTPQEYVGALKFQVMKYNDRHRLKNGLEDLKKAQFYQNELVRFVEEVGHDTIYPEFALPRMIIPEGLPDEALAEIRRRPITGSIELRDKFEMLPRREPEPEPELEPRTPTKTERT